MEIETWINRTGKHKNQGNVPYFCLSLKEQTKLLELQNLESKKDVLLDASLDFNCFLSPTSQIN